MEDGTYGVTLIPRLFEEDDTDSAGGEEGFLDLEWDTKVPYPHNEPNRSLFLRICHGIQHPSCGIPLCLPGHWGESAPWHRPVCCHHGEVSARGADPGGSVCSPP